MKKKTSSSSSHLLQLDVEITLDCKVLRVNNNNNNKHITAIASSLEERIILPRSSSSSSSSTTPSSSLQVLENHDSEEKKQKKKKSQFRRMRIGYVPVVDEWKSEVQEKRHGGFVDGIVSTFTYLLASLLQNSVVYRSIYLIIQLSSTFTFFIPVPFSVFRSSFHTQPEQKRKRKSNIFPFLITYSQAYTQPLLLWHHNNNSFSSTTTTIQFSRVHAYDFDEFCIGDPDEWTPWNHIPFSNRYYFLGTLESVQRRGESREELLERVKGLIAEEEHDENGNGECELQQMGSGIPFLPTYCYNKYSAQDLGMGLANFPIQGIDVAVTMVNHYEGIRHVAFPRDIRIVVDGGDEMEDIVELLRELIHRRGRQDGASFDSEQLFRSEHRGRWGMIFWVMPQTGPRKLYRFTEGKLHQFLSSALTVRTRDKRLYLEAHIVSVKVRGAL